jgi:hypothetical protein
MAASGEYGVLVAEDARGPWRRDRLAAGGFGAGGVLRPCLFSQPQGSEAGRLLVEACIAAIREVGCFRHELPPPSPFLPAEYFEILGSLIDNTRMERLETPVYYRQIREDEGGVSWVHPLSGGVSEGVLRAAGFCTGGPADP